MEISTVILTKNEEKNIKDCLKTLLWCNEIIIIDDYSTDKTVKIAKEFKTRVFKRKLNNNFSGQRNFGLEKAKNDWVLFIDADERVSFKLKNEIWQLRQNYILAKNWVGFKIKRQDKFLGKWLKHGETNSVKLLRLAKKSSGKWQGKVHEVWQIKGKTKTLKNPLIHNRKITISQFITRINKYSSLRAEELYNRKTKINIFLILIFPLAKFFQNYILKLGFLDGIPGLATAEIMSLHSFLARMKLYLLEKVKKI